MNIFGNCQYGETSEVLSEIVCSLMQRKNIIVVGETSTGKTTMLEGVAAFARYAGIAVDEVLVGNQGLSFASVGLDREPMSTDRLKLGFDLFREVKSYTWFKNVPSYPVSDPEGVIESEFYTNHGVMLDTWEPFHSEIGREISTHVLGRAGMLPDSCFIRLTYGMFGHHVQRFISEVYITNEMGEKVFHYRV